MKTNFLLLLFFCGVCISAFGQELQSPQINQNAIFANPGLAGSKGQTRICTALSTYNTSFNASSRVLYNGLVSADGLIMKNKLGVAGYIKNESYKRTNTYNAFLNYNYTNLYMGVMLAPKFEITAKKSSKINHVLSPAIGIGFKGTQLKYSGPNHYNYSYQDSLFNDEKKHSFGLDYASLSLLYSSSNSYSGIKFNFRPHLNTFLLYNVSIIYAKTYSNKAIKDPKFSFTHQFQFTIPTYAFYRIYKYNSYFNDINTQYLDNYFNANFDFRYGKLIFGNFISVNQFAGVYAGFTGGIQLKNTKIIINYSPRLSPKNHGGSSLFISANFLLQPKKKTSR